MHIAWVNLTNGGMSGGYRKYIHRVVPRIATDSRISRIDMFSPEGVEGFSPPVGVDSHVRWRPEERWFGFPSLKKAVRALTPDIVFIPTARWLEVPGVPTVVMVRNMEPLLPNTPKNPLVERAVNVARMRAARAACVNASKVIAVSDFVRAFLVQNWKVRRNKVALVYHGVDSDEALATACRPAFVKDHGVRDFLFLAGSIRPMRGIPDALAALHDLANEFPNLDLVIAGETEGRVTGYSGYLRELAIQLGINRRVTWTGMLRSTEMAWCFQNCRAFVMTSRVEACPNIALEAMSHGAPIISTLNQPMPEFFGAAALYYHAGDGKELAAHIRRLLISQPAIVKVLKEAGVTRSREFDWERCATDTVEVLRSAFISRG